MTTPGPAVIAVDVGGTMIKSMAVRRDGEVVLRARTPTGARDGAEAVIARMAGCCAELAAKTSAATGQPPPALGLAVPGVVDEAAGIARWAANIGWRDAPLAELFRERLGLPVAVVHDVRSAGLAERMLGAGRDCRDFLLVQIGTGIAGSLVLEGRPYAGAHGLGGELGHVTADPSGEVCGCGGRGCLETIASAAAVARRYQQRTGSTGVTAAGVAERSAAGEPAASQVWDDAVAALAAALAWYQGVLDPDLVVLGGGLASAGPVLLDPLRRKLAMSLTFQRMPGLAVSPLGEEAACHGAAVAAWTVADWSPRSPVPPQT
jgi:glucokinase